MLTVKKLEVYVICLFSFLVSIDKVLMTYIPQLRNVVLLFTFCLLLLLALYRGNIYIGKTQILIGVFGIWGVFSLLWSNVIFFDSVELLFVLCGISFFISGANIGADNIQKIEFSILLGGLIAALVLIINGENYYGTMLEARVSIDDENDPNFYAMFLLYPFFISCSLVGRTKISNIIGVILAAFFLYSIMITGSRGALLSLAIVVCYSLIFNKKYFALMALVACLCVVLTYVAEFLSRFSMDVIIEHGGAGRLDIWNVGWEMFKDNFIFGVGLGNFTVSFNEYAFSTANGLLHGLNRAPHNALLEIACELGIIGLIMYILLLYRILFARMNFLMTVNNRLLLGLLAVLVSCCFLSSINNKLVWLLLSLVATYKQPVEVKKRGIK